jgi:putative acetyltransferase
MISINQILTANDVKAAGQLVRALTTWAIELDPEAAADAPTFDGLEAELASLPGKYAPPLGCFLIARDDDAPVGYVAYLPQGDDVVELKRMYVDPAQRRKGVGLMMVNALIDKAKQQKARRILLDSYYTMYSAHKIYRAVDFVYVAAPENFPEDLVQKVVFMEMNLAK